MLQNILSELASSNTTLVAVSKTKPVEQILEIYKQGQRIFGENRIQEMASKYEELPKDIKWHAIGNLQSNKIKYMASFVSMIHSVDSLKLLQTINKEAIKHNRIIDCLLQFKIAKEATKAGLEQAEAIQILNSAEFAQLQNIRICGVMGMATFTEDQDQIQSEFSKLKQIYEELKLQFFKEDADFKEISMGMSGDYQLAIECGSTMVRIGSLIFGKRVYQ